MTHQSLRLNEVANSSMSDGQLIEHARSGDRLALELLLTRYQGSVYRFSMKMCRAPQDAEDVLQDTLFALARGIQNFRGASSLSTWLYTVARSYCIKKRRRSKFAPLSEESLESSASPELEQLSDLARPPDETIAEKQLNRALNSAIHALEPHYREVLVLRDIEGLTAPQVAEILNISQQAVKSRLHRARVAVRGQIAPLLELPSNATPTHNNCPDVLTLFSRHLEGEISQNICIEMTQHLEGCAHCRGACESLKRTLALCSSHKSAAEIPPTLQNAVRAAIQSLSLPST